MIDTGRRAPKLAHIHCRTVVIAVMLATGALLSVADCGVAALPDNRGYEMVSPVAKYGLSPYAAILSTDGGSVDFQARGAFAGAASGSLSVYHATRTSGGWQAEEITPTPTEPLGAFEEQIPLWASSDLSQTIFTTPESYALGDQDEGALSLYSRRADGGLTWISEGTQGGSEPREVTFDAATPSGSKIVFSTGASLLPEATELSPEAFPEPEFLYDRDVQGGQTHLVNLGGGGQLVGAVTTTLTAEAPAGAGKMFVSNTEGFFPGQFITVGEGPLAQTVQISHIPYMAGPNERLRLVGSGLHEAYPAGTPVSHLAEGSILGDGGHLASGPPPAGEYLPLTRRVARLPMPFPAMAQRSFLSLHPRP